MSVCGGGKLGFQQRIREIAHINGSEGGKHVRLRHWEWGKLSRGGGSWCLILWLQSRFGVGREWLLSVPSSHGTVLSQIAIASAMEVTCTKRGQCEGRSG